MNCLWLIVTYLSCLLLTIHAQQLNVNDIQHLAKSQKLLHLYKGEHIPNQFYKAIEKSDSSKLNLQSKLRNFMENLQKNLTMSAVLTAFENTSHNADDYIIRMQELSTFFFKVSYAIEQFAIDGEAFYETSKNSSHALLLKLRQVPTAQPTLVKVLLTNYFAEMEFFHVLFSEILNEALEYSSETLKDIQNIFYYYADTQSTILQNLNLKIDLECCKLYLDFLQHHSAQIFRCATGDKLNIVYDVYAVTKLNVKYIMRQLEFRIQRLLNCLIFKSFIIQCNFLTSAEKDLENLFNKLFELEMYLDGKTKKGSILASRLLRRNIWYDSSIQSQSSLKDCLPRDFPRGQMSTELTKCLFL
ncbi:uncharacterized protein LOC108102086 [Drosophila ficusphila]|uniref:uncharacterized protein LOC108102086 n=1 Tax=Drosophila ficusphila TaxID=30025 RepID=UPI001C8A6452|nr:uncharacterized protein LOC108102086 [Drosophila ficusphila]